MPGVGASEGTDDSVSVEGHRGNGSIGRAKRGDRLLTNERGGSRSPQGKPPSADENELITNEDGLEENFLFESAEDAAATGSSSVASYVDVDGKEVITTKIMFASCGSLLSAKTVGDFLSFCRIISSVHPC